MMSDQFSKARQGIATLESLKDQLDTTISDCQAKRKSLVNEIIEAKKILAELEKESGVSSPRASRWWRRRLRAK